MLVAGSLEVKPLTAKLSRDTDFFDKMDPYVILKVGANKWKSNVAHGQGKNPSWQGGTCFRITNENLIEIEVWDKDNATKDDMIGQSSLAVSRAQQIRQGTEWVNLSYKGKNAGQILLDIRFTPEAAGYANQGVQQQPQMMYPPQTGYPPQQPYYPPPPQQGYYPPPQQQPPGFRPQQGYPPQYGQPVGGYPPQYPPQQYPPQYPPQQYPPQYPPQPYGNQYPPQGFYPPPPI